MGLSRMYVESQWFIKTSVIDCVHRLSTTFQVGGWHTARLKGY